MTAPVMVRGSMRCPVPGCAGMLRPETNGMGRLIEICDDCVRRAQEHARMGHYFRSLERRIAALESGSVARGGAPSSAGAVPTRAAARHGPPPLQENTRARAVVDAIREAGRPLSIAEIIAAVHARDPDASHVQARKSAYNLLHRGLLVVGGRDDTRKGKPNLYTLGPRLRSTEPTSSHSGL